ncbi:hypothetical protein [Microbulbifer variabilis]|uniref:hypothetical protein n=1 Tax=Microbulbifer variabilis TaxID=266805 RepID=UPI001CFF14FF|nr:hypothetical protein [Microbulbifer variabilis]
MKGFGLAATLFATLLTSNSTLADYPKGEFTFGAAAVAPNDDSDTLFLNDSALRPVFQQVFRPYDPELL